MKSMVIIQHSHPGLVAEVTGLLASHDVNIIDFDGKVFGDTAIISIQAENYQRGYRVLSEAGYHVFANETLLVRIEQAPGALARLSQQLASAGVDVRGLHFVNKDARAGIVALETSSHKIAREVLKDQLVG
ncbi:MAG: hypothetical protein HKN70_00060 [Gammaproteobacteria bacterium]|nr:hypothetical protein [Gammaproteobacteria bacterium]